MGLIYLVRHGRTSWNKDEVFRGTIDIPLDDFGRLQAQAVGQELHRRELINPVFFSSPLQRAQETAQIACSYFGHIRVNTETAFTDLNFGEWQGKAKTEVAEKYPQLYRSWQDEPDHVVFPGGDNLVGICRRAEAALFGIAEENSDRDTVIVTHRVVIKALLSRLFSNSLGAFWKIRQGTACINLLEWDRASFSVISMNDTCHLRQLEKTDKSDF
jgi:broad specificity phosphatase PhoE